MLLVWLRIARPSIYYFEIITQTKEAIEMSQFILSASKTKYSSAIFGTSQIGAKNYRNWNL